MIEKSIIVDIKQQLRDILILEYGELWFNYCVQAGVSDDIRMGYLDYLNNFTDGV